MVPRGHGVEGAEGGVAEAGAEGVDVGVLERGARGRRERAGDEGRGSGDFEREAVCGEGLVRLGDGGDVGDAGAEGAEEGAVCAVGASGAEAVA